MMTQRITNLNSVSEYENELSEIYYSLRNIQTHLIELNLDLYKRSYPKFYWNSLKKIIPEYFDAILSIDPVSISIWEFMTTQRGREMKVSELEISDQLNISEEKVKKHIGQLIDLYMYPMLEDGKKYFIPVTLSELEIFLNECWDSLLQECFELLGSDPLVTEEMVALHGVKIMMNRLPVEEVKISELQISN